MVRSRGKTNPGDGYDVVIVGGGSAGVTVAAHIVKQLRKQRLNRSVLIIDPSEDHFYQPLWTLVGAGVRTRQSSRKPQREVIPEGVTWLQDSVTHFCPQLNHLELGSGRKMAYDYLIVCPGLKVDWDAIPGLRESIGRDGVCSNYSYQTVQSTWDAIRTFQGGTAIFTQPRAPIKCGGAPQKIAYLADSAFRQRGVRDRSRIVFCSAEPVLFSVPRYAATLTRVVQRKGIEARFRHNLIELQPRTRQAVFHRLEDDTEVVMRYDMIHVTPPQCALDFIRNSSLANSSGWVDVDKHTLQHVTFPNVFSLGDASSLPTSKTGAAARKQAPVVAKNILSLIQGKPMRASYNGYTSCPLVTGFGKLVLAEFDYDLEPQETFPFDQSVERRSMYLLKKHLLPQFYWRAMLRGRL